MISSKRRVFAALPPVGVGLFLAAEGFVVVEQGAVFAGFLALDARSKQRREDGADQLQRRGVVVGERDFAVAEKNDRRQHFAEVSAAHAHHAAAGEDAVLGGA